MSLLSRTCRGAFGSGRGLPLLARPLPVLAVQHRSMSSKGPPSNFAAPLFPDPRGGLPDLSLEVKSPLVWPQDDRVCASVQEAGEVVGEYKDIRFDDTSQAPLGGYPRNVPHLWPQTRDPLSHWDKQGRREWGEVLPDDYNFMHMFGPGVSVDWVPPMRQLLAAVGVLALVTCGVAWWDPDANRLAVCITLFLVYS